MTALTDRVSVLEAMLKESGKMPPPAHYPPKTTRGNLHFGRDDSLVRAPALAETESTKIEEPSPRSTGTESREGATVAFSANADDRSDKDGFIETPLDDKKDGLVSRLLSTRAHLSFDQLSGHLRYFGGTANCHILGTDETTTTRESAEQARRAEECIRTLHMETHEYLMELFWQHYNSVLHVVHQKAFSEDRDCRQYQVYSGFLHVCILAMGFRFADKSRPDIQRIALPNRESTLHQQAKSMVDLELESSGGIPSIAALLILGDAEVGVGREQVGWMYAGMAMRLCYDLGLQLDSRNASLSQREVEIRKLTLWACVIYDRYWSLFLGRPLTMKPGDLEVYSLTDQFERLGTCMPAGSAKSLNTKVYGALIELMEIAGKIVEQAEFRKNTDGSHRPDQSAYFKMAALDREMHNWASRLPADLRYTERNRQNAPLSFYLLHQQYHAILILLHRPFACYDGSSSEEGERVSVLECHFSQASRTICTESAVTMARMFWRHRQRFDGKQIFCTGMQHAGSAATALIAALAYIPDIAERSKNMQYLEVLHAALQDMSYAYEPAERMAAILNAVITELRGGSISPTHATISARRGSFTLETEQRMLKRRQISRFNLHEEMLPPPPAPQRSNRDSDAASDQSSQSHHLNTSGNIMIKPRSEPESWPTLQGNRQIVSGSDQIIDHPVMHMWGSSPVGTAETQQGWVQPMFLEHESMQAPHMQTPELSFAAPSNMGFLHGRPLEDAWAKWYASNSQAADLSGYPQRGRYTGPYG